MDLRLSMRPRKRFLLSGFTLIELMVSIAVLGLLAGMVMQILASASSLTSNSRTSSDCDTEARFVLDQITADINRRVRRPDVDAFVEKKTGDDRIFFFSETPGYSPTLAPEERSTVSLVGYRVVPPDPIRGTPYQLQRYARALPWVSSTSDTAMPFVILSGSPPRPMPSTTLGGSYGTGEGGSFPKTLTQDSAQELYYQTIGSNVLRFELSLLRKPDHSDPAKPVEARLLSDAEIPVELASNGFQNLSALVVTIAVMDSKAAARTNPSELANIGFTDSAPSSPLKYPMEDWNNNLLSKLPSLSKPVANGLRVYQRVIRL